MNYYYDIVLNFQEKYCMFYEWDEIDNLDYIKKIPLYHINIDTYNDFLTKKIIIDKEILQSIENKTKLNQNKYLKYTCIFSDGKNSIALEFNNNGEVINKSSLLLEDELNINEFIYSIQLINIKYKVLENEIFNKETRQEIKIKKLIKLEIDNIYDKKEFSKLKFIYLEWFDKLDENIDIMYRKMINKLKEKLSDKEYKIYELIKITYNV